MEFKYSEEDLSKLVFKDELTGLFNRRFMYQYLDKNISGPSPIIPFSLLMIDIDDFKNINDSYGHLEGDYLLNQFGQVMSKKLRPLDVPVRYAGDEFSILLPGADKRTSYQLAESISRLIATTKFLRRQKGESISITVSIGVATFPNDARNRETLIDEADKALYNSKNKGKNCVSEAGQLDENIMAEYNLLSNLPCPVFIGREDVINDLKKSLATVKNGQNAFLFLEGEVGIGKTKVLKELERLAENNFCSFFTVLVETDRLQPYKPITALFKKIISSEKNIFDSSLQKIKPEYLLQLRPILPESAPGFDALPKTGPDAAGETDKENRKLLFEGIVSLLTSISEAKPLVILLDEIQNIDEGSLEILTCLSESDSGRILTAAALRSSYLDILSSHYPYLEKFLSEIAGTPNFSHQALIPFDQTLTARLLDYILPQREPMPAFDQKIYEVTGGNPLFVEEIVKNLFLRKKITVKDRKLLLEELKPEDWPKRLDEVIMDNLVRLDQPTTQIINQAAVIGTQMDLKVLKEVAGKNEGETLDIVDKAKHARLIKETDPAQTDNFTFVNQRIQEVAYQSIDEETKQDIHQQVGQATEAAYQDKPEEALAALAYHYQKAGDETKTAEYGYRLEEVTGKLFRTTEATEYFEHGRMIIRSKIKESITPLPENLNPTLREVFRGLSAAAKNMRLYPEGSQLITNAFGSLLQSINTIFKQTDKLTISELKNQLHINTVAAEPKAFGSAVNELYPLFREHYIKSCTFQRGVNEKEIELFLRNLDNNPEKGFSEAGYWNKYLEEKQINNIGIAQRAFVVSQTKITSRLSQAEKEKLADDQTTVTLIKDLLRYFCGAVENIKLYPSGSQLTTNAVTQVYQITDTLFRKANIINFSEVEDILVINGSHINPKIFGQAANTLVKMIQNYGFKSVTFLKNISQAELEKFLTILSNPPQDGKLPINEWNDFIKKNGITNVIIGSVIYKSADEQKGVRGRGMGGVSYPGGMPPGMPAGVPGSGGSSQTGEVSGLPSGGYPGAGFAPPARPRAAKPTDELVMLKVTRFLKDLPDRLLTPEFPAILEKLPNQETQLQLVDKFLENLKSQRPEIRTKTGPFYLELLNKTTPSLKKTLISRGTPALLQNLKTEKEPAAYDNLLEITRQHLLAHLQENDYQTVKNLVWAVSKDRQAEETFTAELQQKTTQALSKLMVEDVFSRLVEGLKSNDAKTQQTVANIFSGLGPMTTPVLINLLKESEELHLREATASLLREFGAEVIPLVVNELSQLTEAKPINRFLGVIDIINPPELNEILIHYLKHQDGEIKTTALTTIKRLSKEKAMEILIPLLNDKNIGVAVLAVSSLGGLGYPEAVPYLINLLQNTGKKRLQKECCIALGKIGDAQAVPILVNILGKPRKFFGMIGGYADEIRGVAAWALCQFKDELSRQALENALDDKSTAVRSAAKLCLKDKKINPVQEPNNED